MGLVLGTTSIWWDKAHFGDKPSSNSLGKTSLNSCNGCYKDISLIDFVRLLKEIWEGGREKACITHEDQLQVEG